MIDIRHNQDEIAWSNWLAQFEDSERLESLVRSLYWGANRDAKAASELYLNRWLDTARGAQLDGIGDIVQQPREILAGQVPFFGFISQSNSRTFGQARLRREPETDIQGAVPLRDAEYRQALRWKIAVNRGTGTAKDIADAVNAVFNTTGTKVANQGNAKITVIVDVQMDEDNPLIVNKDKWVPVAAGVGFEFAGFRQSFGIISDDGDTIISDDNEPLDGYFYQE